MKSEEYTKLFEIEQNNWWYKSRRRLINNYLRDNFVPKQSRLILDVATAAGTNLFEFNRFGKIIGIDIAQESLKICQSRNIKDLICGDAMNLPFANNSFDMVFAFDALEHFSDDHKTVSGFYDTLKPQGKLLITAPAFMALWSEHDEAFHHFRRYKKNELEQLLKTKGFYIEYIGYWSMTLFIPVYLYRKMRTMFHKKQGAHNNECYSDFFTTIPKWAEKILGGIQLVESILIRNGISFPFGVSLFCIAFKKSNGA